MRTIFGTVLRGGHATSIVAGHVEKLTDSEAAQCFAIAADASSRPISCGNGDQS